MAGDGEWRLAIEAARAEVQRLRIENWRLERELRSELSQEVSTGQLHCRRMAAQQREEADASAGAPAPAGPMTQAEPAAGGAEPDLEATQRTLAEAEGKSRRLRQEVVSLKSGLREPSDLRALQQEVTRMRELLAQPEEAWHSGGPLLPEEPGETASPERQQSGSGGEDGSGVLLAEVSFEMLANIGEVEMAEEKKALQQEVRRLQAELGSPSPRPRPRPPAPAAAPADALSLRRRRRLQQLEAIAGRLHEEFQLRSGTKQPATGTPDVTQAASLDLRSQLLEDKIKALSHRFLLIRDMC